MNSTKSVSILTIFLSLSLTACVGIAKEKPVHHEEQPVVEGEKVCEGFGPQAPRDIDGKTGTNKRIFSVAPSYKDMNLCNIHFHVNAEHKAKDFALFAGEGEHGHGGGYKCTTSSLLTKKELMPPKGNLCEGLKPGDTVEVHWVYSSCDIKPGESLGSCLSESCSNPNLRVEAQVFLVVNDPAALNFNDFAYDGNMVNDLHQAKSLPSGTGNPIEFLGSTTGPKYNDQQCSPFQVTWSVRPECAKIDINSLGKWCEGNVFKENHGHGVRKLVTDPKLLSEIK